MYISETIKERGRKCDLVMRTREKAFMKRLGEFYYDKIVKNPELLAPYIGEDELLNEFSTWNTKRSRSRYKYIMFTINFKEDVTFKEASVKVLKAIKKVWIINYYYSWEWRNGGEGMHIHLRTRIKDGKKTYDCKREMYNTFKNLVGNKLHVNVRYSNDDDCFIKYIRGLKLKNGEYEQKPNHEWDTVMRKKYHLKDFYSGGDNSEEEKKILEAQ